MSTYAAGRPAADEHPAYAAKYLARVPEEDILAALQQSLDDSIAFVMKADLQQARTWAYEPGKWTLCDVIGHICDTERILAYRTLRIARGDSTPLPGFEEDAYAANAPYQNWTPEQLVQELRTVRAATLSLLMTLRNEDWSRRGTASASTVTVRALAWFICGHERHHLAILKERYAAVVRKS